jgi:LAO/AO transport system kinase
MKATEEKAIRGANGAAINGLVEKVRAGDTRALARAISLVENHAPDAGALLSACFPHTGKTQVIGLTGAPGAGKSTLTNQLARAYRAQEKTVGVIAVDPTSHYTGGAILGDRIRMQSQESDTSLYVRSMATRGFMGGLARTTADVATVMEASGKDVLLIETVGVGQDEIDIVRLADVTVVMLVPGMGDDVQSLKAGIMEIANIFVINKCDRDGADRVEREVRMMQSLISHHEADMWIPPVVRTIASEGTGIEDLQKAITRYEEYLVKRGLLEKKRAENWRGRLLEMMRQQFVERGIGEMLGAEALERHATAVAARTEDPYVLVPRLMEQLLGGRE